MKTKTPVPVWKLKLRRAGRWLTLAALFGVTGCAGGVAMVGNDAVRPAQLKEPVFVVVPANQSNFQDDYATRIERHLLASGMRVAIRPIFKAVRIEAAGSETQSAAVVTGSGMGGGGALSSSEDRVIDSFLEMTDTSAHYRINTYANSGTIELVDLSTQQILTVLTPGRELSTQPSQANHLLAGALRAIGFSVASATSAPERQRTLVATLAQPMPILTVIPSSDWPWDAQFALSIERLLVRLGLHVVRPPAPHYREQSSAVAKSAANALPGDFLSKSAAARKIESFWEFGETVANVILETASYNNSVRIIDKASREVRSVVTIHPGSSDSGVLRLGSSDGIYAMRDALVAVGIPVAELPKPAPSKPAKPTKKP